MYKRNLATAISAVCALSFLSGCSLLYYDSSEDIPENGGVLQSESSSGQTEDSSDVILKIVEDSRGGKNIYYANGLVVHKCAPVTSENSLDDDILYQWTTEITRDELFEIPANTSYGDILDKLGQTTAYGYPGYRQYITEGNRMIAIEFNDKSDLCPYSGEELYSRAISLDYDGENPEEMLYGVITCGGRLFTHYMQYYNTKEEKTDTYTDKDGKRCIVSNRLIASDAEIVFEDGSPASEDDLKPGTAVLVDYDYVLECWPGQMHCTKIVILE